jgi:hypothetical protein
MGSGRRPVISDEKCTPPLVALPDNSKKRLVRPALQEQQPGKPLVARLAGRRHLAGKHLDRLAVRWP